MGAIVNALFFGELAMIISAMNVKKIRFEEKVETAQSAMKNIKLDPNTQTKVVKYLSLSQRYLDSQFQL